MSLLFCLPAYSYFFFDAEKEKIDALKRSRNISLVYVSENLDSPISSFGHLFLVFHQENEPSPHSVTLDYAGDLTVDYFLPRSLLFSIPGQYRLLSFYEKQREYEWENRTLYIAPLELNESERNRLIKSLLEKIHKETPYNFFITNCADYIHDLAWGALDGKTSNCNSPQITTPLASFRSFRDCGKLKEVWRRPSKQKRFASKFYNLPSYERAELKNLITAEEPLNLDARSLKFKKAYSSWIDYSAQRSKHSYQRNKLLRHKVQILSKASKTNLKTRNLVSSYDPAFFENIKLISGFDWENDQTLLGFSPAYLHFENTPASGNYSDELVLSELEFAIENSDVEVKNFTPFRLVSTKPKTFFSAGLTRILSAHYEEVGDSKTSLQQTELNFAGGRTLELSSKPMISVSGMLHLEGGYYHQNEAFSGGDIAVAASTAITFSFTESLRGRLSSRHYFETHKAKKYETLAKVSLLDSKLFGQPWNLSFRFRKLDLRSSPHDNILESSFLLATFF